MNFAEIAEDYDDVSVPCGIFIHYFAVTMGDNDDFFMDAGNYQNSFMIREDDYDVYSTTGDDLNFATILKTMMMFLFYGDIH